MQPTNRNLLSFQSSPLQRSHSRESSANRKEDIFFSWIQSPVRNVEQRVNQSVRISSNFQPKRESEHKNNNQSSVQLKRNNNQILQISNPFNQNYFSNPFPFEYVAYLDLQLILTPEQRQIFVNDQPKYIKFKGSRSLRNSIMNKEMEKLSKRIEKEQKDIKVFYNLINTNNLSFQAINRMFTADNRILTYKYLLQKMNKYLSYQTFIREIDEKIRREKTDTSISFIKRGDFLFLSQNSTSASEVMRMKSSRKRMESNMQNQKYLKILQFDDQILDLQNQIGELKYFLDESKEQRERLEREIRSPNKRIPQKESGNKQMFFMLYTPSLQKKKKNNSRQSLLLRSSKSEKKEEEKINTIQEMIKSQNDQIEQMQTKIQTLTGKSYIIPKPENLLPQLKQQIARNQNSPKSNSSKRYQTQKTDYILERDSPESPRLRLEQNKNVNIKVDVKNRKSQCKFNQDVFDNIHLKVIEARDVVMLMELYLMCFKDNDFLRYQQYYERELNFINFGNDSFGRASNELKENIFKYINIYKLKQQQAKKSSENSKTMRGIIDSLLQEKKQQTKNQKQKLNQILNFNKEQEIQAAVEKAFKHVEQEKKKQRLKQIQEFKQSCHDLCNLMLQMVPLNMEQLGDQLKTLSDDDEHYEQKVLEYRKELISNYLKLCTENFKYSIPERIQYLKKQENSILQSLSKRPREQIDAIIQLEDSFYEGLKDIAKLL